MPDPAPARPTPGTETSTRRDNCSELRLVQTSASTVLDHRLAAECQESGIVSAASGDGDP